MQQLMCRVHWFSVPKPLRDQVWRTWRAFLRSRSRDTVENYKAARDAAIRAAAGEPADVGSPGFTFTTGRKA